MASRIARYLIAVMALGGLIPMSTAEAQLLRPRNTPTVTPQAPPAAAPAVVATPAATPVAAPSTTLPRRAAPTAPVPVATTAFDVGVAFAADVELDPVLSARGGGGISPFFVLLSHSAFAAAFALLGRQWRASRPDPRPAR
jgi:hypothetical protein